MDQAERLRQMSHSERCDGGSGRRKNTRMIAVASGKGGVGKTNTVANLGYALTKLNKKVVIFDCDLGLGNMDILLGIPSKVTLEHVLAGKASVHEIIKKGPGGMSILPAASGVQKLAHIDHNQQLLISAELDELTSEFDIVLLDIGAGISKNVTYFCTKADDILVIATGEPTSITDAYALMKVLHRDYKQNRFKLLVNNVASLQDAKMVYKQISIVVDKFLENISLDFIGFVLSDPNLPKCVKQQKLLLEQFPFSKASKCYSELAHTLIKTESYSCENEAEGSFFQSFLSRS